MAREEKNKSKRLKDYGLEDYFDAFEKMSALAIDEVDLLLDIIENFTDAQAIEKRLVEAHQIETDSDDLVEITILAADADFLPPIDREDIVELVIALDEITDKIEKVIKHLFMYDVDSIEPEAVKMCELIREECLIIHDAMRFFRDFRKPKKLKARAGKIDEIEEEIDRLYLYAIRDLFTGDLDPTHAVRWRLVYSTIEECSDTLEHAVDLMVRIVVKNA